MDAPLIDDEDLSLEIFKRLEPKCSVCGADAPGEAWTRYRPCCGKRTCEACEKKITGRDEAAAAAAQNALEAGDTQWAMELADRVMAVAGPAQGKHIKIQCIRNVVFQEL